MEIVTAKSFELEIMSQGDRNASKLAIIIVLCQALLPALNHRIAAI
jgi:hypothetical protein